MQGAVIVINHQVLAAQLDDVGHGAASDHGCNQFLRHLVPGFGAVDPVPLALELSIELWNGVAQILIPNALIASRVFVGFENFIRLFKTSLFHESVGHTVIFLIGYAGLTLTAGFLIALLLKQNVGLSGLYITLLFIPWIIADVIAGLVFRLLVAPDYGLFSGPLQNPELFPPNGLSILTAARQQAARIK